MSDLHSINHAQGVYVMRCGSGFSCLGFDVAERKRAAVLQWIGAPVAPVEKGTPEAFAAYLNAMQRGAEHNRATGKRCPADLSPALIGLEGRRVEVAYPDGQGGMFRTRFIVGKSMGWMPCHLEIKRRDSTGGAAAYVPAGASVRVVA